MILYTKSQNVLFRREQNCTMSLTLVWEFYCILCQICSIHNHQKKSSVFSCNLFQVSPSSTAASVKSWQRFHQCCGVQQQVVSIIGYRLHLVSINAFHPPTRQHPNLSFAFCEAEFLLPSCRPRIISLSGRPKSPSFGESVRPCPCIRCVRLKIDALSPLYPANQRVLIPKITFICH